MHTYVHEGANHYSKHWKQPKHEGPALIKVTDLYRHIGHE